ncbi:TonB-dependent receptor [Prevotella sp. oral taxon 820]|nr:TonB-dependent receptor [Prevotella sp. oral taxon 820]PTL25574.1 TonB-dependent receptor [Prevotella sp. oral taxon 820]
MNRIKVIQRGGMLALLLSLCVFTTAWAESPSRRTGASISGVIKEKKTGEPLSHVSVKILGTMLVNVTDAEGRYRLENLPEGRQTIEVRMAGYRSARQPINVVGNVQSTLDFSLTEDEISLDEVVVSSNRSLSLRRNAPTLVNVIDTRMFDITQSLCLAQGLNFQPGVRTEDNCANCGFSQVRINGLDGHYSQILIDSRPVFTALQGVYGLEQIPANMVERVEVARGGGSALFGSSAIGGTINIITKEPTGNWAELSHTLMGMEGGKSFDNSTTLNTSIVSKNNRAGFSVYASSRHRDGYDRDHDGFTDLPKLVNKTVGLNSFLRLSNYSKLTLQYHALNEFRRGGNHLGLPAHESNIAEQLRHEIHGGNLGYDLFTPDGLNHLTAYASFQSVSRDSYYGGTGDDSPESREEALKAYSKTRDLNVLGGMQFVHSFARLGFMPADFTLGAEYSYDGLKDHALGYNVITRQHVRVGSLFFQNEWKNERWSLLLGGRVDKHNLIKQLIFSPRANLRFNPIEEINLRLTYAGGFRAPQTFDEDLHTTLAGGERLKTRLASGLKEERSNSISLSADMYHVFGKVQTNLLIEGFFTHLDDVFAQRKLEEKDAFGNGILERYNANAATVLGLNVEGKAAFSRLFQLQAGITWQQSRYKEAVVWDEEAPKERKMMRTPNLYGYFTATVEPVKRFTMGLTGNYTGGMLVGHAAGSGVAKPVAVNTPAFMTLNLKLTYDIKPIDGVKVQLNGGVQNLTDAYQKDIDRGWNRDAAYIYGPSQPRTYYVGVKVSY